MICKICSKEVKGLMIDHYKKKHLEIYQQFYKGASERMNQRRPADHARKAGRKGLDTRWGKKEEKDAR